MKRLSSSVVVYLSLLLVMALVCVSVYSQNAGGGIVRGVVKDINGAAIPGASIIITGIEGGRAAVTISNKDGLFITPSLNIGKYKIRVEVKGMKAWEGDLLIETARTTDVTAIMELGDVADTIVVQGNIMPLISESDPTDGATLDKARIQELPLNGRDMSTLISDVTPGVEMIGGLSLASVRAGGLMEYSTDFSVDGSAANSRELGRAGILPGLDSVGEVRIETSTSSAKYNRPTSVIISTKSGSNKFHGSLFEINRNSAYGTARSRQDVIWGGDYEVPKLIRNEYGGSISGPLYLPTFGLNGSKWYKGKDKTFFFFSRENANLRQYITQEFRVPTAAMREGDFSELKDAQQRLIMIYDPQSTKTTTVKYKDSKGKEVTAVHYFRTQFPNNKIPLDRMSPLAKYIFSITPLPNDGDNPFVTPNLKMAVPTTGSPNFDNDMTTVRLDHRISDSDNFYFRVYGGFKPSNYMGTTARSNAVPTLNNETNNTYVKYQGITGALSWTHIFSPTFSVETQLNRQWIAWKLRTGVDETKNWSDDLGLPNPFNEIGWPALTNLGWSGYSFIEGDNRRQVAGAVTNFEQNYSLLKGSHNFQFGFKYTRYEDDVLMDQGAISGAASFNSNATSLHDYKTGSEKDPQVVIRTGSDLANFFLGHASTYTAGIKRQWMRLTQDTPSLYFQDTYKISPRLTLTPGMRWDMNPAFKEKNHMFNSFDVKSHSIILDKPLDYYYANGTTTPEIVKRYQDVGVKFATAEEVGRKNGIIPSNLYDISPRAGFAYKMFDGNKTMVLRGGYGIYYAPMPMRTLTGEFSVLPPFATSFRYDMNSSTLSPDSKPLFLLRAQPTVIAGENSANVIDLNRLPALTRGTAVRGLAEEFPSTKIHEWNLTVEKQLSKSMVFRVSYKGKHGVNADQYVEINPQASDYVWNVTTGSPVPTTGEYSNVNRRVYDKEAYTAVRILQKTGYINTSMFSFEFERRFSKGLGFQAFYSLTNSLRMAGDFSRDDVGTRPEVYIPGTVPTNFDDLNRFLYYDRDTAIPKHRVRWNWSYELPFGKGKALLTSGKGILNAVIGNWKLSGSGTIVSSWYSRPAGNWGEFGNFEVYGKKYPIWDCTATPDNATHSSQERCTPGYLWYNGYISQKIINNYTAAGVRDGIFGLPDNYKPAQKPVNPWPTGGKISDANSKYYDTNIVKLNLNDGTTRETDPNNGLHPWRNQSLLGPLNWTMNASLMKYFPIKERLKLRANFDVFNVFNRQGLNTPNSSGIVSKGSSFSGFNFTPRRIQIALRLEW